MSTQMTEEEWAAFLRAGTRTGKLALVLPSGRPSVTPVWFLYGDDGVIRFETGAGSAKVKAMRAEPRVSMVVDLEEPPYAFVRVDGTARIIDDDPDSTLQLATDIGARYMGEDRAAEFGQRNGGSGQVIIELSPTRVVAAGGVSD